jgi:hypothetical protein
MANERIESGRVQLTSGGAAPVQRVSVPEVNFVASRVQAQGSGQLAEALDRMSANLFGDAFRLREQEGLQFAAQNPLTPEQIEAAKNGNLSTLNLGDNPLSVFQNAVRKARSLELANRFEMEGRNELVTLLNQVEMGQATSEQVQTKIATMIDGMGKSLAGVDPEAAYKFRATMATQGSAVLKSSLDAELKRAQSQASIKFDSDFDNAVTLLEKAANDDAENFDFHASVFATNITRGALRFNSLAMQQQYSEKAKVAIRNAKIGAVTKELLLDPNNTDNLAILGRIRTGEAGSKSRMLQNMIAGDFDAVTKIEANVMAAINNRNSLMKQRQEVDKQTAVKDFIPLYNRAIALPEGSSERKKLIGQIAAISERQPEAVPLSVLKDLQEPSKEGNPVAEFNTLRGIFEGRITNPDQIWRAPGLTAKQKVTLLKTLTSEDRRDQRDLDTGLARLAGIPTMPGQVTVIDPKGVEFQRLQGLRAQAMQIQAEATREGKVLTPRAILQQVESGIEQTRNTEGARAARKTLDDVWAKKDWINAQPGGITKATLPDLKRKAGNDKAKLQQYNQIERLVSQAEGE